MFSSRWPFLQAVCKQFRFGCSLFDRSKFCRSKFCRSNNWKYFSAVSKVKSVKPEWKWGPVLVRICQYVDGTFETLNPSATQNMVNALLPLLFTDKKPEKFQALPYEVSRNINQLSSSTRMFSFIGWQVTRGEIKLPFCALSKSTDWRQSSLFQVQVPQIPSAFSFVDHCRLTVAACV